MTAKQLLILWMLFLNKIVPLVCLITQGHNSRTGLKDITLGRTSKQLQSTLVGLA